MKIRVPVFAFLVFSLLSYPVIAEDHAILIGAGKYHSGKWGLDLVDENIRLVEKTFVDEVGISAENIQKMMDRDVRRTGVRVTLRELARSAKSGDRLFVYYTGHATKVMKEGAPIRAHFTWDTVESYGGEGFDPETLITDIDLKGWLRPVREKGIQVIIIREACFCGGGYAQDISTLSPGKPPTREPIGDVEISACDIDQAAWALDGATTPVALFTSCLADCLSSNVQKITAKSLYDKLRSRVTRKQRNQTPILDLGKGVDPNQVVLVDRTIFNLVVNAVDAVTGETLSGVKVLLTPMGSEETMSASTPTARFSGIQRQARVFPWIEKKGYVSKSHAIEIPHKERFVVSTVELSPEVAEVKGKIGLKGSGSLSGVIVTYESGIRPLSARHVDSEVKPRSDGSFYLKVPPRSPCRVLVVKGTDTLASVTVDDGRNLMPVRCYDPSADEWAGETYDVGTITIDLVSARPALTEAERAFEDYFRKAGAAEENGKLNEALRCLEMAREAASMVDDATKQQALSTRAAKGIERVEAALNAIRYDELVSEGKVLLVGGDPDGAKCKAENALELNPKGVMARLLLKDAEGKIADRDRRREPVSRAPKPERTLESEQYEVREIPGFTFLREETFSCGGQTNTVKIYNHEKTGLEFVFVPGGCGVDSFLICRTECTQAAWDRIGLADERKWRGPDLPIEGVTWQVVSRWCYKAGLRLPTLQEWVYACRANSAGQYFFGNSEERLTDYAWYQSNSQHRTHSVGQKKHNAFGIYDMHGNVEEWLSSDFSTTVTIFGEVSRHKLHYFHGGSWFDKPARCRTIFDSDSFGVPLNGEQIGRNTLGFRPAASLQ